MGNLNYAPDEFKKSVNPIKVSPAIGAAYALQGVKNVTPVYHAAPGCTFLSKVLLTRHFREPVSIDGSDIKQAGIVYGGFEELSAKIASIATKQKPEIIAIVTSSVSELRGDDFRTVLNDLKEEHKLSQVCVVSTPDYSGGFAEGFSAAVVSLVEKFAIPGSVIEENMNIFPAPYMNCADVDEIKKIVKSFSLNPVVIPDISISKDGAELKYRRMAGEGASLDDIVRSARSGLSVSFGQVMKGPGDFLESKYNVTHRNLAYSYGINATDELIHLLIDYTQNNNVPLLLKRERARLVDLMIDAHLHLSSRKVHIALEYDHAMAVKTALEEWGLDVDDTVVPFLPGKKQKTGSARNGGLYLLEEKYTSSASQPDILIANSHGTPMAQKFNIPFLSMGFPVYDSFGGNLIGRTGYNGATSFLIEVANKWVHQ